MNPSTLPQHVETWLQIVRQQAEGLQFGSIQITVHEDRVTMVEKTERVRFNSASQRSSDAKN